MTSSNSSFSILGVPPQVLARIAGANIKLIDIPAEGFSPERHDDYDEAIFVLDGRLKLQLERRLIILEVGDYCLIPSGASHHALAGSASRIVLVDAEAP